MFGNNPYLNFNKIASLAFFLINKPKPKYVYEIAKNKYVVKYKYLVLLPPYTEINLTDREYYLQIVWIALYGANPEVQEVFPKKTKNLVRLTTAFLCIRENLNLKQREWVDILSEQKKLEVEEMIE